MDTNQNAKAPKELPQREIKQISPAKALKQDDGFWGNTAWIVVLVVILGIAIISLFVNPSSLSSIWRDTFSRFRAESIDVSLSTSTTIANTPIFLSFRHNNKSAEENGSYYLSYECGKNISLALANVRSAPIFCDRPFDVSEIGTSTLLLIPNIIGNAASTTVEITYVPNATTTDNGEQKIVRGNANLSVTRRQTTPLSPSTPSITTPKVETTPKVGVPPQPGEKTERYYKIDESENYIQNGTRVAKIGNADLSVKILAVGKMDQSTNRFSESNSLRSTDRIGIKFTVTNSGTEAISGWQFITALPILPPFTFVSEKQQNLLPGEHIEYTIAFDNVAKINGNIISVTVDPDYEIAEKTRSNNVASVTINGINF